MNFTKVLKFFIFLQWFNNKQTLSEFLEQSLLDELFECNLNALECLISA